jgi:hypothetical protein
MIRKLQVLGLAVVAVLAMSALGASAAQAAPEFTCSAYPCTATGSNTLGNEKFTTEAGTVECDSHFLVERMRTAKEVEEGKTPDLLGPSPTVTVTPTYTGCTAFGFLNATVNVEGCDYIFHATEAVEAGKVYKHHVDVHCPANQSIKIVAGTCRAEVTGKTKTETQAAVNQGLTTVTTTNLAGGSVTVQPNVANIDMHVTQDGFGCPFNGTGTKFGTYHGDVVISRVGGGSVSVSG